MASSSLHQATETGNASSRLTFEPETQISGDGIGLLACPVCYEPLIRKGPPGLNLQAIFRSAFECKICHKLYNSSSRSKEKDIYLDLTVSGGLREYIAPNPAGTDFFRYRLVSFLYERGWRQYFGQSGFPGPDQEFKMAMDYFESATDQGDGGGSGSGGVVVDVSCGSGLFSRRFAKSGAFAGVVALDFSESMLRQCYNFLKADPASLFATNLGLVRADVSRLPFASGSVDAVHAGAALHCWPSPSNAVAEITRILRSGAIFVGTTFLRSSPSTPWIFKPFREKMSRSSNSYLTEREIEDLCRSCGLTNYSSKVQQSFIMFSARKPAV